MTNFTRIQLQKQKKVKESINVEDLNQCIKLTRLDQNAVKNDEKVEEVHSETLVKSVANEFSEFRPQRE